MTINQLNKLQIKAEILIVLTKFQTNLEAANVDGILKVLTLQNDKKIILEVLIKELLKANEQKVILICFLALKLCDKEDFETALWGILKNPSVFDSTKTILLNVLKDMGNKVDYEKLEEYFDNPNEVIDADTQKLLQTAIINPEAQIDFLDFLSSLPETDKKILVQSLGEDYSSDNLANILNPLVLYNPTCELGKIAIDILGTTKSQLALHTLVQLIDFVYDEDTLTLVKKNISKLKISGVREDNAIDFYKSILNSKPYCSYASYPDGHGNQALIFSREREDESIQMVAIVINDTYGIVDCFGFNDISKLEFERIVDKFYKGDEHIYLNPSVIKTILSAAEKLTRKLGEQISYEYICWKNLLSDIQVEVVPIELTLKSQFVQKTLSGDEQEDIYMLDFIQRWFFDVDYNEDFRFLISSLNSKISTNNFEFNLDEVVSENLVQIFTVEQKDLLDKRILMSAYLKYLSGNKEDAQLLYSLYFEEKKKLQLSENIIRKSIYEYYVLLKFKYKEEHKMTNIFALRNKPKNFELTSKQIDLMISAIEKLWVENG
ncbi:MAG: hypothetical protein WCG95_02130 [bacterium]